MIGDFNAHDDLWHSSIQDTRGTEIAETIGDSNFGILNNDSPTRLPPSDSQQPSSPDLSLASMALLPYSSWETITALGSDHLPIVISCETNIQAQYSERKTFVNFKKADWSTFFNLTEENFAKLSPATDVYKAEKCFRKIVNNASKQCIPKGRIKKMIPEIPAEASDLMQTRDELRKNNPTDPQIGNLNKEIESLIRNHKRDKWREHVSNMDRKTDPSSLFKLIKRFNGQPTNKENQGIRFKGKYTSSAKSIANKFNEQYSSVVRHTSSKLARRITKDSKQQSLSNASHYTPSQTQSAIKQSKSSKALGPDGISNIHLKHLGPAGIAYLTEIFNLSVTQCQIPQIWKSSVIIPLLKPGKPAGESGSYRPVSLLCPSIKILERLILPSLNEYLPIPDYQHGFRKLHSTVSALIDLNQDISSGFNQKKPADRTVLLQIDMSKAFDMVSHQKLIKGLNNSNLPPHLKRWFSCYLHGRQSKVSFRNTKSKSRNVRGGVPQGAVTSPVLFNFYLAGLPRPPPGISIIQYADDISIYACGRDIQRLSQAITDYVKLVKAFLDERELKV